MSSRPDAPLTNPLAVSFGFLDARLKGAVESVAANDPNPSDPFRGLYISDELALSPAQGAALGPAAGSARAAPPPPRRPAPRPLHRRRAGALAGPGGRRGAGRRAAGRRDQAARAGPPGLGGARPARGAGPQAAVRGARR